MMKSIHKGFYHLQMAKEYFDDVTREAPRSVGARLCNMYSKKLAWIKKDFASCPLLPSKAASEFNAELSGDIMFPMAIAEKVLRLSDEQRTVLEELIDALVAGEDITIETL
jgi:hypothetical protein